MRKFLNFGLLGMLFMSVLPACADQYTSEIKMLISQAMQSQLMGEPDVALDKYQQALTTAKGAYGNSAPYLAEIYYDMGSLCLSNSKFEKAEGYLNQALKLNPNSSAAHLRLSELKLLQSHFVGQSLQYFRADEAAKHALAVLAKHSNDVVAHKELALAFEEEDDNRRAYKEYAKVDDLIDGRPIKPTLASITPAKARVDDETRTASDKAQMTQQDTKKKAEQEKKSDSAARKKSELEKKNAAEAKKRADQDKKNVAAKKKAEQNSKKKAEQEKKKKAAGAKPSDSKVAGAAVGIPAILSSKAVLLTSTKKKPAAAKSVSAGSAVLKKPATSPKMTESEAAGQEESEVAKELAPSVAKKASKAPVSAPVPTAKLENKAALSRPGKHATGLVPPPPPVIPAYTMMPLPQAAAPAKPKPQPKKEEKPKEQPVAKEDKTDKPSGADDDDFLIDWAGTKAKKKK